MKSRVLWLTIGVVIGAGVMFGSDLRSERAHRVAADADLEESFAALVSAVEESGVFVRGHRWYGSDREQAEAYRHIVRVLINALQGAAQSDPDFPYFKELGPLNKSGMDNSDQRYLIAEVDGAGQYRIWGQRGSSRRLDITLYEEGSQQSASFATLADESLVVGDDGRFEVFVGGERRGANWLPTAPGRMRLMVRQIHSEWTSERPGFVHVDRVDAQRPTYPSLTRKVMAERLRAAADFFADAVRRWPELSRTRIAKLIPANSLTPPRNVGDEGGLAGRWMVGGHFELEPDQALLIKAAPTDANYQGIQLGHHWWESLDYANRQTSLTADQARVSSDGAIYFVVSERDPGFANWLDTEGFRRGVIMMRYDGMTRDLTPEELPHAELVELAELRGLLPEDEPSVSASERADTMRARRRHVQRRFGL